MGGDDHAAFSFRNGWISISAEMPTRWHDARDNAFRPLALAAVLLANEWQATAGIGRYVAGPVDDRVDAIAGNADGMDQPVLAHADRGQEFLLE